MAWNSRKTAGARGNLLPLRKGPEIERIAATVSEIIDFEVLVLVEINVGSRQWQQLKAALDREGYRFVEGTGGDQRVVIAYDADEIQLDDSSELKLTTRFLRADRFGSGQCEAGGRLPPVASLTGGAFRFTLVAVHLKSMRQPDGCDDPTFTGFVRGRQVSEIAARME